MAVIIQHGDACRLLPGIAHFGAHAVVTDPPYGLRFMNRAWDYQLPAPVVWQECFRILPPGGHLLAFGGTRTYHRLACDIEDAGFEIRDCIMWLYGQGFPKSLDVSKAIDKAAGADREVVGKATGRAAKPRTDMRGGRYVGSPDRHLDLSDITAPATEAARQWHGWGTALKPACEPIIMARRPLDGTVAGNVLRHECGALNIDACRVGTSKLVPSSLSTTPNKIYGAGLGSYAQDGTENGHNPNIGRWPANVAHDGSAEVLEAFAAHGEKAGGSYPAVRGVGGISTNGHQGQAGLISCRLADSGTAARFFYCAKASTAERNGSRHPTIKPVALMRWLVRLVTPPGGIVLDPFAGSGTTGQAAQEEGMHALLVERDPAAVIDCMARLPRARVE